MSDKGKYASVRNDFEARLLFLSIDEGGRQTPFVVQGYRPDFSYEDELDALFMIWPVFVDEHGEPLAEGARVPTDQSINARMVIINDELRATEHRKRIKVGLKFFVREGGKIVAGGVVTRVVDLFID
jgi:translation elongation factor EF-Tu-like GTPase